MEWKQTRLDQAIELSIPPADELKELGPAEREAIWGAKPDDPADVRYWKIAPGPNAVAWNAWRQHGIASIGWAKLGDLTGMDKAEFDARAGSILEGHSPTVNSGGARSFSLLFDMNRVFEDFIAAFMHAKVMPRLNGYKLHPQARRRRRHLMRNDQGHGVLPLKPDLLVEHPDGRNLVIDTKWKRLDNGKDRKKGVGGGDLYQLFAYTHRYGCAKSILLYPSLPGLDEANFDLVGEDGLSTGRSVGVRYVNVNRNLNLVAEREGLSFELESLISGGFQDGGALPIEAY